MYSVYYPKTGELKDWTKELAIEIADNEDIDISWNPDEFVDNEIVVKELMEQAMPYYYDNGNQTFFGKIDTYVFVDHRFAEEIAEEIEERRLCM